MKIFPNNHRAHLTVGSSQIKYFLIFVQVAFLLFYILYFGLNLKGSVLFYLEKYTYDSSFLSHFFAVSLNILCIIFTVFLFDKIVGKKDFTFLSPLNPLLTLFFYTALALILKDYSSATDRLSAKESSSFLVANLITLSLSYITCQGILSQTLIGTLLPIAIILLTGFLTFEREPFIFFIPLISMAQFHLVYEKLKSLIVSNRFKSRNNKNTRLSPKNLTLALVFVALIAYSSKVATLVFFNFKNQVTTQLTISALLQFEFLKRFFGDLAHKIALESTYLSDLSPHYVGYRLLFPIQFERLLSINDPLSNGQIASGFYTFSGAGTGFSNLLEMLITFGPFAPIVLIILSLLLIKFFTRNFPSLIAYVALFPFLFKYQRSELIPCLIPFIITFVYSIFSSVLTRRLNFK